MEHKRFTYEVLVNSSSRGLVWRRDYNGHVPDTAIQMGATMVEVWHFYASKAVWLSYSCQFLYDIRNDLKQCSSFTNIYLQVDTKKKCNNWFSRGAQMLSSGCNPLLTIARNGEQYYKRSGVSRQWEITYFGRAKINKGVIVPGYVVPSHGEYNNHFNMKYTFIQSYHRKK